MLWKRKLETAKEQAEKKGAAVADAFRHVTAGDLEKAQASLSAEGIAVPAALREAKGLGALAIGAAAFGVVAIGAFAIGRLSVGRLRVGDAEVGRLRIGELEIGSIVPPPVPARRLAFWRTDDE